MALNARQLTSFDDFFQRHLFEKFSKTLFHVLDVLGCLVGVNVTQSLIKFCFTFAVFYHEKKLAPSVCNLYSSGSLPSLAAYCQILNFSFSQQLFPELVECGLVNFRKIFSRHFCRICFNFVDFNSKFNFF